MWIGILIQYISCHFSENFMNAILMFRNAIVTLEMALPAFCFVFSAQLYICPQNNKLQTREPGPFKGKMIFQRCNFLVKTFS